MESKGSWNYPGVEVRGGGKSPKNYILVPSQIPSSCVTSGKFPNLSEPRGLPSKKTELGTNILLSPFTWTFHWLQNLS